MATPARYSTVTGSVHAASDADEGYAPWEISPGDRIGQPLARSRGKSFLRASIVILCALGAGGALFLDPSILPRWWSAVTAAVSPGFDRSVPGSASPPTSSLASHAPPSGAEPTAKMPAIDALTAPQQPLASTMTAASPVRPDRPAVLPPTTPAPEAVDELPVPAQRSRVADPYQRRAEAVGLHPDLSRVLLEKLSDTDYRNAGIAIRAAMAETPDDGVFVWPRQRKPELALFHVRFVPGAAPDCRRYVVTVAKDGWLTTALPMEKCGAQRGRPRRE
jgi:hypothetical protein